MKRAILLLLMFVMLSSFATAQNEVSDLPWWNDRVFYEIFVRSFYDSDGDGIGDLQGIIEKLDYLNDGDPTTTDDLGVTGIWLMPINAAASYHGYDVTDYYQVNPDYGTNEDFIALIDAAHERGIAVIMDLVINHTSNQHPWFRASRMGDEEFADWYIWEDENPGYAGPWGAQAWHQAAGRYYYAIFWDGMPDLNYTNPEVTDEIYEVSRFWLEDMGADGFRMDAVKHLVEDGEIQELSPANRQWLISFQSYLQSVNPDVLTVGELFNTPSFRIAPYIEEGALSIAFDFDLATDILSSVGRGNKRDIARMMDRGMRDYPHGQFASFLTNHDQTRVMTQLRGDVGANKVAATILLTLPGVPFIYYGEEYGMEGAKPDERLRTPMHWDGTEMAGFTTGDRLWEPLSDGHEDANIADQTNDSNSLLSHYRNLIHIRNEHPALQTGEITVIESSFRSVLTYLRHTDDEVLLILMNLDDEAVTDYSIELETGPLANITEAEWILGDGAFTLPEVNTDGGFDAFTPLPELQPYGSYIIQLK